MHEIWYSWTYLLSSHLQWPNYPFSRNSSIKSVNNNAQLWYWICFENQTLSFFTRCVIFTSAWGPQVQVIDLANKFFFGKLTSIAFWSIKYKLFIWRLSIMSEFFVDCVGLSHICAGGVWVHFYIFILSQKRFNYLMEKKHIWAT